MPFSCLPPGEHQCGTRACWFSFQLRFLSAALSGGSWHPPSIKATWTPEQAHLCLLYTLHPCWGVGWHSGGGHHTGLGTLHLKPLSGINLSVLQGFQTQDAHKRLTGALGFLEAKWETLLPNPECLHLFVPREASKSTEMGMSGTHEAMSKMLFILIFLWTHHIMVSPQSHS